MTTEELNNESAHTNNDTASQVEAPRSRRGFAAMDRELVRAIAKRGGVAAHVRGTAHQFTREEAREAGRKGGLAAHKNGRRGAAPAAPASPTEQK
jgi:general stress protein YciG